MLGSFPNPSWDGSEGWDLRVEFLLKINSGYLSDSVFSKDALLSHKRERKRTWIPLNPCLVGRGVVPTAR